MVVHIGMMKTGTTFLQKSVFAPNVKTAMGCDFLGRLLMNDFISCESFYGYPYPPNDGFKVQGTWTQRFEANVTKMKDWFNNPKIIICFREQSSAIKSHYKQYLKQGGKLSYEDFFNLDDTGLLKIKDFEYSPKVDFLKLNFENVFVYLYEDFRDNPNTIINALEIFTGFDFPLRKMDEKHNVSIQTDFQVNALRLLNHIPNHTNFITGRLKIRPRDIAKSMKFIPSESFKLPNEKEIKALFESDWSKIKSKYEI